MESVLDENKVEKELFFVDEPLQEHGVKPEYYKSFINLLSCSEGRVPYLNHPFIDWRYRKKECTRIFPDINFLNTRILPIKKVLPVFNGSCLVFSELDGESMVYFDPDSPERYFASKKDRNVYLGLIATAYTYLEKREYDCTKQQLCRGGRKNVSADLSKIPVQLMAFNEIRITRQKGDHFIASTTFKRNELPLEIILSETNIVDSEISSMAGLCYFVGKLKD